MWYPIRSATQRRMVHSRFEALQIPKMLTADLAIHPDDAGLGLAGSGLMIVNPPYGADEFFRDAYAAIHHAIAASRDLVDAPWPVRHAVWRAARVMILDP